MEQTSQALQLLEAAWLAASPRRPDTVRAYRNELNRLRRFLQSSGRKDATLDAKLLERFWHGLIRGNWHSKRKRPSTRSIDQSRRILSAFVTWAVQQELAPVAALTAVAAWRTPSARLGQTGARASRGEEAPISALSRVSTLDGAAAALCFWVGATPRELAVLGTTDIDTRRAMVALTLRGERGEVAIPRSLSRSLQALVVPGQRWFFRRGAESPTPAAMAQRVSRWLASTGVTEISSARALRAEFKRHARERGWNSDEIGSQLRCRSLPTPVCAIPSHRRLDALLAPP